jgi:hypothetical protein
VCVTYANETRNMARICAVARSVATSVAKVVVSFGADIYCVFLYVSSCACVCICIHVLICEREAQHLVKR